MNTATKGTFLTRLSSLILMKAIFVFLGMAIILYQPDQEGEADQVLSRLSGQVQDLGRRLAERESAEILASGGKALQVVPSDDAAPEPRFRSVQLIARDSLGRLVPLVAHESAAVEKNAEDRGFGDTDPLTQAHLQALIALPDGYSAPASLKGGEALYIRRVDLADGRPTLLVAIADHDLFISNRTSLLTIVMILFLASGLVSLLIVSLIRRRFQAPLKRLTQGMQMTARGEPFSMPDDFEDSELAALAQAFNSMSDQLLKQRRDLIDYNERLRDSNEQLLESQLFLSALLDSTPLCVVATSPDGRIMLYNRTAGDVFGYAAEEAIGKNINAFIAAPGQLDPAPASDPTVTQAFEARCRRQAGESFPAYVIFASAHDNSGKLVARIYIIRDITESRSFQEMMIRLDRYYTRGEMAGDIAHEINNYLAILSGNIELMPIILRKGDHEKIDKKLGVMKETADKIARFTDGLMDGPHEEARFEPTDLNQLVANVLAFLKPQNKFDYVKIETDLSADMPLVEIDNGQIQQLLVNFIYNAAEALEGTEKEKLITIKTAVSGTAKDARAHVQVSDTGPGVAEDKQAWLFRKRFTTKPRGHGIGLITCQRIVDTHGGQVRYERAEATTFSCTLPIRHAAATAAGTTSPRDVAEPVLPDGGF